MAHEDFDVAVVGGGLAGGLAALALAARGFRCAVVDARPRGELLSDAYDGRTTAIAYASARLFRRLGIWDDAAAGAGAIDHILVSDGDIAPGAAARASSLSLHFEGAQSAADGPLGWIFENRAMRRAIYARLADDPNVALIDGARRTGAAFADPRATVDLDDGRRLAARLVVAADGRGSPLRAEAGIKTTEWGYGQTAIVATVALERPHGGVAHELFLPSGPFAILPLARNRASIVWTEKSDAAPAYLALSDEGFRAALAERIGDRYGAVALDGPRETFPVRFTLAHSLVAPRLALVGDAARAIHPIAGQGFNLGVKDVAALTDAVADARGVGLDIGALSSLGPYERWRRFDGTALALGTDFCNRLFSNDVAPIRLARRLGLGAVNAVDPLRRFFMREAGADSGDLPSLMRPIGAN